MTGPPWLRILGLVWVLWLGGPAPGPAPPGPRALDGDTVLLADGERVRLCGVDTPELGRPFAEAAGRWTARFLAGGAFTLDPPDPPRDRYGRLLADLRRGDESLSESLVAAGLAWVYRSTSRSLLDMQAVAVEHRRGVHRGLGDWRGGLLVVTRSSFHRLGCPLPGRPPEDLPLESTPEGPFKSGLSPCRRCLPWPPMWWPDLPR